MRENQNAFTLWDGKLFRLTRDGPRIVAPLKEMVTILTTFNDDIDHWDLRTAKKIIGDGFAWPNMQRDVFDFMKSCDACQKVNPIEKYISALIFRFQAF